MKKESERHIYRCYNFNQSDGKWIEYLTVPENAILKKGFNYKINSTHLWIIGEIIDDYRTKQNFESTSKMGSMIYNSELRSFTKSQEFNYTSYRGCQKNSTFFAFCSSNGWNFVNIETPEDSFTSGKIV